MTEQTLIKTMPRCALSSAERGWDWHPDANLVVLAADLCAAGREVALSEVQAHWRRSCLRVVDADYAENYAADRLMTEPMDVAAILSAAGR